MDNLKINDRVYHFMVGGDELYNDYGTVTTIEGMFAWVKMDNAESGPMRVRLIHLMPEDDARKRGDLF